jgi:hypothetical protein
VTPRLSRQELRKAPKVIGPSFLSNDALP